MGLSTFPLSLASSVGVGLCSAGCAAGPNYLPPPTPLAPFHNRGELTAASLAGPAPPLDSWWRGFDDPMLVTVVQRALDQNLDLTAAFASVLQARAAASAAGAELLPTIDLDAAGTAERQSLASPLGTVEKTLPGYDRNQREYSVGAAASWEIDLAGGLRRGAAAARDEAEAARAEQTGTRVTTAADAADAYIQIRGFQARLAEAYKRQRTGYGYRSYWHRPARKCWPRQSSSRRNRCRSRFPERQRRRC